VNEGKKERKRAQRRGGSSGEEARVGIGRLLCFFGAARGVPNLRQNLYTPPAARDSMVSCGSCYRPKRKICDWGVFLTEAGRKGPPNSSACWDGEGDLEICGAAGQGWGAAPGGPAFLHQCIQRVRTDLLYGDEMCQER